MIVLYSQNQDFYFRAVTLLYLKSLRLCETSEMMLSNHIACGISNSVIFGVSDLRYVVIKHMKSKDKKENDFSNPCLHIGIRSSREDSTTNTAKSQQDH